MDSVDDEARKALHSLLNRKDLKSTHITVVEVSALMNVNVDELFVATACAALRSKLRLKILSFSDALKIVTERNRDVSRLNYFPLRSLPSFCLSSSFVLTIASDTCFSLVIGIFRLRALLPNLPRVFATLLDKSDVAHLSWTAANHLIHSHPLFDEFFQPLGQLGKQLDPLPSDYERRMSQSTVIDHRIPAEILLRHEARLAFEGYKQPWRLSNAKKRWRGVRMFAVSDNTQVHWQAISEMSAYFLQVSWGEIGPRSSFVNVFWRISNCSSTLFDHIGADFDNEVFPISEREMLRIKEFLQDDFRYRQLSRLFEHRDSLVRRFIMFLARPTVNECPSFNGCAQLAVHDAIAVFFQKYARLFLLDVSWTMPGNPQNKAVSGQVQAPIGSTVEPLPPVYVLVCDPAHYDLLPYLHQQKVRRFTKLYRDPNQIGASIIPIDVHWNAQRFAVDLHLGAYHSWLTPKQPAPPTGTLLFYSARRAASFAHARAAVSRVLDDGCRTLTGKAILLVAVAELQDYFSDEVGGSYPLSLLLSF
ncbi:hypothetical protein OSTOST_15877, partial [Ostertagia ostertagi]